MRISLKNLLKVKIHRVPIRHLMAEYDLSLVFSKFKLPKLLLKSRHEKRNLPSF
jgi:hypothetical protein